MVCLFVFIYSITFGFSILFLMFTSSIHATVFNHTHNSKQKHASEQTNKNTGIYSGYYITHACTWTFHLEKLLHEFPCKWATKWWPSVQCFHTHIALKQLHYYMYDGLVWWQGVEERQREGGKISEFSRFLTNTRICRHCAAAEWKLVWT